MGHFFDKILLTYFCRFRTYIVMFMYIYIYILLISDSFMDLEDSDGVSQAEKLHFQDTYHPGAKPDLLTDPRDL